MAGNTSISAITRCPTFLKSADNEHTSIIHFVLFIAAMQFIKNYNVNDCYLNFMASPASATLNMGG